MKQLIVLIHGIFLRSDLKLLKYWGVIPKYLKSEGYDVLIIDTDAFGSISNNVKLIKLKLGEYLLKQNHEIIHLIGHSKGGVEALKLLNDSYFSNKITSLILLNAPITGQVFAKKFSHDNKTFPIAYNFFDLLGCLQGDKNPCTGIAVQELAINHYDQMIQNDVTIFCVQACNSYNTLPLIWRFLSRFSYGKKLKGDGLVEYQNIQKSRIIEIPISKLTSSLLTHNSATGLPRFIAHTQVNIKDFWKNLLRETIQFRDKFQV